MTAVLKAETYTSPNNIERGNGSNALEIFKDIIVTLKRQILKSRLSKAISPLWHCSTMNALTRRVRLFGNPASFAPLRDFFHFPKSGVPTGFSSPKLVFLLSPSSFSSFFLSFSLYHTCFCTMKTKLLRYFQLNIRVWAASNQFLSWKNLISFLSHITGKGLATMSWCTDQHQYSIPEHC